MVSSTANGFTLNFSKLTGVLPQQNQNRAWLINTNCVANTGELALIDRLLQSKEFK